MKITPTSVVRSAIKEVTALTRLNSAHIVQLLGVQVDVADEKVYMVMELCQGGELFDRIAECGGLAEDEAKRYFVQILHALAHCHDNRVYHRDLKPENILLDAADNAKVADFGLAAVYRHVAGDASYLQHTKVGSVMYAAPEVLRSTAAAGYDAACADIWSLGVILFSMLSGTLPFTCAAEAKCKRYAAVLQHGIGVMCPEHLSPQVTHLLERLLHPDPRRRTTPQEALRSEWVYGLDSPWPREVLRAPPDEITAARSWTITMRVRAEDLAQLPPRGATGAGAGPEESVAPSTAASATEMVAGGGGGAIDAVVAAAAPPCTAAAADVATSATTSAATTKGTPDGPPAEDASELGLQLPHGQKRKRTDADGDNSLEGGGTTTHPLPLLEPGGRGTKLPAESAAAGVGGGNCGASSRLAAASKGVALSVPPRWFAPRSGDAEPACRREPPTAGGLVRVDPGGSEGADGGSVLGGLPLCGCVSEYVRRFGWGPLPDGTQALLRDILQALQSMGLQYQLEEQHSLTFHPRETGYPPPSDHAQSSSSGGGMRTCRMTLRVLF